MKEIHVYLTGRLGNQLFQYAFARKLQQKYGGMIICNVYDLEHKSEKMKHVPGKFHYDMNNYLLNENVEIEDQKLPWYADINSLWIRVLKKTCPRMYFKFMAKLGYLIWQRDEYIDIPELKSDKVTLCGWWQDFRYFKDVEEQLANEIVPVTSEVVANEALYDLAKNTESVCVSLRGGNYLVPKVKKLLFVCDKLYFYNAIKKMNDLIDNPCYIIFSDDLEWVRSYVKLEEKFPDCKFYYESGNDTVEEKIRLMTKCKHFIISNSTFSWWAQFLSKNKSKTVIAPDKWFTDGRKCGLYMDNWVLVNVNEDNEVE